MRENKKAYVFLHFVCSEEEDGKFICRNVLFWCRKINLNEDKKTANLRVEFHTSSGSQSGRVKRRDKSFQAWPEEPLGTDSHRTISKRSRECWFLIGRKKCFVLLCPISGQFLLSSFREFVHDGYYLATVARFVRQAFLTRNKGITNESKNVSDAISRSNSICTEKILFLTDHNVS